MTEVSLSIDAQGLASSEFNGLLSYESRIFETALGSWPGEALRALALDCAIADCPLLARTFWMGGRERPRCVLEALALEILRLHVPAEALSEAGAEWWVQRRPGGRSSMLEKDFVERATSPPSLQRKRARLNLAEDMSIGPRSHRLDWHFDKDEELAAGTPLFLAPQLSTVTYLTTFGGPTVVLNCVAHPMSGEPTALAPLFSDLPQGRVDGADVVFPTLGRHLKFDGRKMHAVVPALASRTAQASEDQPRLTLLVNVWIGHKPLAVEPFPNHFLDKLSPASGPLCLFRPIDHGTPLQPLPLDSGPRLRLIPGDDKEEQDKDLLPPRKKTLVFQPPAALANWSGTLPPAVSLKTSNDTTQAPPIALFENKQQVTS